MRLHTTDVPVARDRSLRAAVDAACARIAPAWPLDRLIAVNPHWGWVDQPIASAAASIGALNGARFVMPRAWFAAQLRNGRLDRDDLARALERSGHPWSLAELIDALGEETPTPPMHPLVTDLRDQLHDVVRERTWRELAVRSIGRACEAYFDEGQASWHPDRAQGLYATWRTLARVDAAPRVQLGLRAFREAIDELPDDPHACIADALDTLGVPAAGREAYCTALLLSVQGWAAACAFRRWEARLAGDDDHTIVELLATRLAWELVLFRTSGGTDLTGRWARERLAWGERAALVAQDQALDWVLQRALELRYHDRLATALAAVPPAMPLRFGPAAPAVTRAQAVFCIDVRSEVFRRHLETADPGVHTLGFAGFFGVPLAYAPVQGAARPQLPGLLPATLVAEDRGDAVGTARARAAQRHHQTDTWRALSRGAPSAFSFVEATGLTAAFSLLRGDLAHTRRGGDPLRGGLDAPQVAAAPVIARRADGSALDDDARADLAAAVLRAMSLTEGFARLVAFIGHGAGVTNNPQAAGLACGACGGQSGEVNARALAALLNEAPVRTGLAARGIVIPEATRFVGGVHDTVTDAVTLYAPAECGETHHEDLDRLAEALRLAGEGTRRERAARLGIAEGSTTHHAQQAQDRAVDWSEVRPEWALARNAAFIAAPRTRTRPLRLDGRAFLHEYRWQDDRGFTTLETIMTAPMVVAHWINLQYYASTVDPERYGSGDKTLHNVVGGALGVYEGAGGDLRIGLARQSVHDGTAEMHEPLRLAVYLEAPVEAIDAIIAKQAVVRQLVEHEWLHLYAIATEGKGVFARRGGTWTRVQPSASIIS